MQSNTLEIPDWLDQWLKNNASIKKARIMADVHVLPGVRDITRPSDGQPQQEVINLLSSLLTDAVAGKLQAVACATVHVGDSPGHAWETGDGFNSNTLMAAIACLFHRYAQSQLEIYKPTASEPGGESA